MSLRMALARWRALASSAPKTRFCQHGGRMCLDGDGSSKMAVDGGPAIPGMATVVVFIGPNEAYIYTVYNIYNMIWYDMTNKIGIMTTVYINICHIYTCINHTHTVNVQMSFRHLASMNRIILNIKNIHMQHHKTIQNYGCHVCHLPLLGRILWPTGWTFATRTCLQPGRNFRNLKMDGALALWPYGRCFDMLRFCHERFCPVGILCHAVAWGAVHLSSRFLFAAKSLWRDRGCHQESSVLEVYRSWWQYSSIQIRGLSPWVLYGVLMTHELRCSHIILNCFKNRRATRQYINYSTVHYCR